MADQLKMAVVDSILTLKGLPPVTPVEIGM